MVREVVREGLSGEELGFFMRFKPENEYVSRALGWAIAAHRDQKRKLGEPYIIHPIEVARILKEWGLNRDEEQAAGLLHDTVEDTETSLEDIKNRWGSKVAGWVENVSKFGSELETLRNVTSRSFIDAITGLLKLADRLHNMRTLFAMPPKKQNAISRETMDVYTELAESLGMWIVKEELSDLAFKYLDPDMHTQIDEEIRCDPRTDPACYLHYKSKIEALFAMSGMECEVNVRFKGRYSTYLKREKKIFQGECSPNDLIGINDLVSLGVIVKTREDCYKALEKIQNDWDGTGIADQPKDLIGNPADNNYQALQTGIQTSDGPIEIAIMTAEMKAFNDLGVAYKMSRDPEAKPALLKPVFLPSGKAMFMPPQSTGVDLMCRQDVSLARKKPVLIVDGQRMPVTVVLPVGATAEVIPTTEDDTSVDDHLFKYCLPESERKLRNIQLTAQEEKLQERGRKILEELLKPRGVSLMDDLGKHMVARIVRGVDRMENRVKSQEQLYHLIGGGFLETARVSTVLDEFGVTKSELGLSTILVTGNEDKPGILDILTGTIAEYGGNIKAVHTQTENGFEVRIIVKGINHESEDSIRDILGNNPVFQNALVI